MGFLSQMKFKKGYYLKFLGILKKMENYFVAANYLFNGFLSDG